MDTRETLGSLKKHNIHLRDIMHESAEDIYLLAVEMEKIDNSIAIRLYNFVAENYPGDPIQSEVQKKLESVPLSA